MMPPQIKYGQPRDSVLDRYNHSLNNYKLDENGNVFTEAIVRTTQLLDWTLTKYTKLKIFANEGGNPLRHKGVGASSLWDMVRRFLNHNLRELNVEALEAVPWEIMKRIWDDVLLTGEDNFRTWALFASVYGHEPEFTCVLGGIPKQHIRRAHINRFIPIESLIAPISSPSFKWLVDLDLQASIGYTRFDFLELSELPNLSALNISRHQQSLDIDDSIVRAWAIAAAQKGKFTALKVLVLKNNSRVTSRALEYLSWIKSLVVADLTGCGVTELKEIGKLGWVADPGFVDMVDDPHKAWKIMRGEGNEENGVQKLVLQVSVGTSQSIPTRVDARAPAVFRRENSWTSAKRKQETIPHPQIISVSGMASDGNVPTFKKRRVRSSKGKDMGSLLAEFGVGSVRGKPSK